MKLENKIECSLKGMVPVNSSAKYLLNYNGQNANFEWVVYKGDQVVFTKEFSAEDFLDYTFNEAGKYKVVVVIKDENQNLKSLSSEEILIVNLPKLKDVLCDNKGNAIINTNLNFNAIADGENLRYHWYIYKDSSVILDNPLSEKNSFSYTPTSSGVYKALVYIKDEYGNIDSYFSKEIVIAENKNTNPNPNNAEDKDSNLTKALSTKTNNLITVDTAKNKVYVYEKKNDSWSQIKVMSCTDGKPATPTIKGSFYINGRGPWLYAPSGKVKAQYKVRIHEGYYFHSILYNMKGALVDTRLGQSLSHGCVRLSVSDAKWLYENIKDGTGVHIF